MDPGRSPLQLKAFFAPASAALVGATEDQSKFGGRLFRSMLDFGFQGPIFPINPSRRQVFGLECYPSILELPQAPDHVGVIVPASRVMSVLEQCAARGVRFVTVLSGGFSETGTEEGRGMQRQVGEFAVRTGIRIMGPNCNGFINFVDGFAMTNTAAIRGVRRPAGNVGLVSHSGGLGQINVMWRAQEAGVNLSYQASCGNEADLDAIDFARFMVADAATEVIVMAVEAIRSGPRFELLAREAAERQKPILMLKFGRTEAGRRASASHTGAITGSDEVHEAAFRQLGVIRVNDCDELYEFAKLLRTRRWPRGRRAASVTGSGGHAVLVADLGESAGIEWARFGEDTARSLRQLVPEYAGISNPMDLTSAQTGAPTLFPDALELIAGDPAVDVLVPILVIPTVAAIEQIERVHQTINKPMAVLWTGFCAEKPEITPATLASRGLAVYRDALTCLKAVRAAIDYGKFLRRVALQRAPGRDADLEGIDIAGARATLSQAPRVLPERLGKEVLAAYGLPVTRERLAHAAGEAAAVARDLGGAVALKVESPDIPHRTEAGAVRLGVQGDAAVAAAFSEVLEAAKRYAPRAQVNGVLVQEMVPAGLEMMLGMSTDPVFGPVLAVAIGGVHVEVLRDVAHRIPPVSAAEAKLMLEELRAYRLLEGVRGAAPRDVDALCEAIVRVSRLARDLGEEIAELDINPLMVLERGKGVRVVDALIVRRGQA